MKKAALDILVYILPLNFVETSIKKKYVHVLHGKTCSTIRNLLQQY